MRLSGYRPEFPYDIVLQTLDGRKSGRARVTQPSDYDPYNKETRISLKIPVS